MNRDNLEIYKSLRDNFSIFAKYCLKIRTKAGDVTNFEMNKSQKYVHDLIEEQRLKAGRVRVLILKARQQGISTYAGGRCYWRTTHEKGFRAFILSHEQSATEELFSMAERFNNNIQDDMRPSVGASNSKELYFDKLDSGYKVGTAGNKAVGRGSTIQIFHGSEVAFWPNDREHAAGVLQAVPNEKGTEIILESTGNGMGNLFYEMYTNAMKGDGSYLPIFLPWFLSDEYVSVCPNDFELAAEEQEYKELYSLSNEQMYWRRIKINELGKYKFAQEYPATPQEAFQTSGEDSFISPELSLAARASVAHAYGNLILGVDPAGDGKDRTAFVWRKGMKIVGVNARNCDLMETVGIIVNAIGEGVDKVFIDVVGVGAGVFDRLKELGYGDKVVSVKGGSSPDDDRKYFNKRSECWGRMKEWLENGGSVPANDELHMDLTGLRWKYDSSGRVKLESKQDLRTRGAASPDLADALSMTFAYRVRNFDEMNKFVKAETVKLWS